MRRIVRWMPLVAGTLVSLAISVAAYQLADYSWNQVVDYRGPYTAAALPQGAPGIPVARRVVLVIIDGLREDVSRKMATVEGLRDQGSGWVVVAGQPSLSFPTWTTLLSGAPQRFSGVTTNWYDQHVKVETLIDTARAASQTVVVSGNDGLGELFRDKRTPMYLVPDIANEYQSAGIVDAAVKMAERSRSRLVIVHLPDVDKAGHRSGGASKDYLQTAARVDRDLSRLVSSLQSTDTAFVVVSDHGHIDTGGHGGWEDVVVRVPAVFAGAGIAAGSGTGTQDQVAPTIALLAGLPAPRNGTGAPLRVQALLTGEVGRFDLQRRTALTAYTGIVKGQLPPVPATGDDAAKMLEAADGERLATERLSRLPLAGLLALGAVAVLAVVFVLSWRAGVSAVAGVAAYYLVYEGLFFLVHRYQWSLSSFNSEDLVKAFMNGRLVEAAIAGVVGAAVAADVYLVTRHPDVRRPAGEYLPGWLSLGTATVLAVQATLALQMAWYLWWWGASLTWYIPDLKWGFKYDLDLLQLTALGVAALLAPVVTYLVGRYHPLRKPGATPDTEGA